MEVPSNELKRGDVLFNRDGEPLGMFEATFPDGLVRVISYVNLSEVAHGMRTVSVAAEAA
ncbi:MAG TPA: hypothetical protein VIM34_22425 [Burkholderiaceae bacterium]